MPEHRLRTPIALALALLAAGAPLAAQPRAAPAAPRPAGLPDEYSYRGALGGLWNYRSCGVHARAADYQALAAELRSIESLARSKGLGPTLERVRDEYNRQLAISLLMPCGGGPVAALAGARRAMAVFRTWAEQAPAHALTQAEVDSAAAQEILAVEDDYAAAALNGDEAALRRIVDDGFVFDRADGTTTGRDGLLANLRGLNLIHYRMKERTVLMRGGAGTVTGILELASASAAQAVILRFPYTATYRRRDGVWRMIALHMSPDARP
jgi:ketosteroid isomerase-like protein